MSSTTVYAYDADYQNMNSDSWLDSQYQLYAGLSGSTQYRSRMYFNINLGDGRPITISKATCRLHRNDGGDTTGNITLYVGSYTSTYASNLNITAGTGGKTWTLSANQRAALLAKNKSNIVLYIHHATTSRKRFTGYDNSSYDSTDRPRLTITWSYNTSTGTVSSNYYDNAATLTIDSAYDSYTHKVSWLLPDDTVYYTETLAAGTLSSSCIFYGDSATTGSSAENYGEFFGDAYSATFKVKLETYTDDNSLVGTKTYNVVLTKPQGFSLGSIEDCPYDSAATLRITPAYPNYSHEVEWYLKDKDTLCQTDSVAATGNTNEISVSYSYFDSYDTDDFFTDYSQYCPAFVTLKTYATDGTLQGKQTLSFKLIKEPDRERKVVDLTPDPIIMSTSVIVSNNLLNTNTTLNEIVEDTLRYALDTLRPVGSIYVSCNDENPSSYFYGTWEPYAPARTLLTTTDIEAVGETGGSFTHTLTVSELPSHKHVMNYYNSSNQMLYTGTSGTVIGGSTSGSYYVGNTGGGGAHNNTQPYAVCNMWIRVE